ncbi:MAG: hypothetical protein JXA33_11955 [Anaerolineae bacterium]|nr:hypothetical protein [Anaerolineae bacterium]
MSLDFAFFVHLHNFYREQRGTIRRRYRELTRRFLDYNDPENTHAFLRQPQFEALEMYVFLKEYLDNAHLHQVFQAWMNRAGRFEGRGAVRGAGPEMEAVQPALFEQPTAADYEAFWSSPALVDRKIRVYTKQRRQAR